MATMTKIPEIKVREPSNPLELLKQRWGRLHKELRLYRLGRSTRQKVEELYRAVEDARAKVRSAIKRKDPLFMAQYYHAEKDPSWPAFHETLDTKKELDLINTERERMRERESAE